MSITKREAQANVRRTGQLWARGRYDSNVCISVDVWPDGSFIATAEDEHITLKQFERALVKVYGHSVKAENDGRGYLRGDGKVKA